MRVTTTAKAKIALPVTVKINPVRTLPPGLSLPSIALIEIVCFMGKIVFKLIKPKERKKETRVFVTDGRNAHSAVLNIKSSPKNLTNATMRHVESVGNLRMQLTVAKFSPLKKPLHSNKMTPLMTQ